MSHDLTRLGRRTAAALFALSLSVAPAMAQRADPKPTVDNSAEKVAATSRPATPATKPAAPRPPADQPAIKMGGDQGKGFLKRHEQFLADLKAKEGKVDVLFVGDSITDAWRRAQDPNNPKGWGGKAVFDKAYAKHNTLNLGISGDQAQHVLWRLENGEVEGISPKAAVLMIGTNNLGGYKNEEIVAGVTKIVRTLNQKLPTTKVLLLGVFPRGNKPSDPARARVKEINEQIAKLDDGGKTVKYLDIGQKFLAEDGTLPPEVMPDYLHPNDKGYQIWAEAMQPTLDELMK